MVEHHRQVEDLTRLDPPLHYGWLPGRCSPPPGRASGGGLIPQPLWPAKHTDRGDNNRAAMDTAIVGSRRLFQLSKAINQLGQWPRQQHDRTEPGGHALLGGTGSDCTGGSPRGSPGSLAVGALGHAPSGRVFSPTFRSTIIPNVHIVKQDELFAAFPVGLHRFVLIHGTRQAVGQETGEGKRLTCARLVLGDEAAGRPSRPLPAGRTIVCVGQGRSRVFIHIRRPGVRSTT